ncbi:hypothetical protein DLE60_22245 [Micromonospora globispora]|uniref:DUF2510 domain-containing protein n=1 Tax=Micromonospora globispora TaxID=1450148 RepID=UPI000D6F9939|nr:DUF2510 domain-containing protein [Micromonospora globispora]PWU58337.1 hypothetical protein DLE60_22245 [Micromonospora globispora]RQW87461.1 hypothetical protein DKL51_25990 [Micromonospora globispora]
MALQAPQPGWYVDPSGRHEYRYWSGAAWTEHVVDRGEPSVEPFPPRQRRQKSGHEGSQPAARLEPEVDNEAIWKAEREAKRQAQAQRDAEREAEREAKRQAQAQRDAERKAEREAQAAERRAKAEARAANEARKRDEAQAAYARGLPKRLQASAQLLGIKVKDGWVYKGPFGSLAWPAQGSRAELYAEDNRGKRVTLTRIALTGIFALGLKKKTGKLEVHVTISGDGWSVSGRTENVEGAHAFVTEWNGLYGRGVPN